MDKREFDPFAQFSQRFDKSPEHSLTEIVPNNPIADKSVKTPVNDNKPGSWQSYWINRIVSQQHAETVLRDTAKGWYAIALLQGLLWILFLSHTTRANVFGDVLVLIMAGYYIPRYKSRAFATAICFTRYLWLE